MRRVLCAAALVPLLVALYACAPAGQEPESPTSAPSLESDVQALGEFFTAQEGILAAGDEASWIAGMTEDVIFMPPNEPTAVGKDAVRDWGHPFFDTLEMHETYLLDEIEVVGNLGFVRGNYEFTVTPKEGGESMVENGKFIAILQRQDDGSWKMWRQAWNLNPALPE